MKKFTISTENKPNLELLMEMNPAKAQELIRTFVDLIEVCAREGWHELPTLFDQGKEGLTFPALLQGVLEGALNLYDMNPEMHPILKEEVHPLSMLAGRVNLLDNQPKYRNWRRHYKFPIDMPVNSETIARIIRMSLRYYRYVDVESLQKALTNDQVMNWRGLTNPHMLANLPFVPALRYQERFSKLEIGKMYDEIGGFDCGDWTEGDVTQCPACAHSDIKKVGNFRWCMDCNAAFKEVSY